MTRTLNLALAAVLPVTAGIGAVFVGRVAALPAPVTEYAIVFACITGGAYFLSQLFARAYVRLPALLVYAVLAAVTASLSRAIFACRVLLDCS